MNKERKSVTVDPQVAEHLSQTGTNASELVNKLVKQHMNGGAGENEILEFRISQVEGEISDLKSRLERKQEELSELQDRKQSLSNEQQQNRAKILQEAYENTRFATLNSVDHPIIDSPDAMIDDYADRLDITTEELRETLISMEEDNGD